jgi:PAS domain S-box-containing protein
LISHKKETIYKITVSLAFGLIGFFCNFNTIIFHFGDYTVAVLFGLLFPLLIALSWGWKYGLLSALAGGCQSMWWLWGPSNGYAIFLVAPPFTLWVVWHGFFAGIRSQTKNHQWWLNMYILEIPFRILCSINLLAFSRWAIALNPPPWNWAAASMNTIPLNFSVFVAIKQAGVAFVLLLSADVLLNIRFVRTFFRLAPVVDQRRTGYVVSIFLLIGCLFWLLDSFFHAFAFNGDRSFIAFLALDIPASNLFTRIIFLISCMASGMVTSRILRKQKQGEMALRKAKEEAVTRKAFLKTLVRTIPDLVWLKNPQGTFLSCNSRFERFFGANEAEIVGKTDYDFVDKQAADAFKENDRKAIARGEACKNEEDIIFADDGHHEHLETIKTPMYNNSGELIGVLGIGRDITERVNLQAQLVQAQKMESVGRLAGGVAHDFNNMLSIILGNSEMVLDDLPKDSPFVDNLKEIKNAAERSSSLTRQLLAFARKQTISPKVINLNDVVGGILKMLSRLIGEDIDLAWLPAKNLWPVKVDPSQVDQILANLCVNARDSIKNIGKVTIGTGNVTCDAGYCSQHHGVRPGDYVVMTVSDTGCGMTRETLDHIFEPFYTTKDSTKGTGLGLATVFGIMKQNSGFINVYSEPEKGSAFRIYFPRHTGKDLEKYRKIPKAKNPTGRETILLVEDEQAILQITKTRLEQLGYTVLSFSSPLKAIEISHQSNRIDLLITDIVMPEMNGRDLAKKITLSHPAIKCLFMSGYTADVIARHGILDDGLNFISKPFSSKEFSIKVRGILDERPG